jgi:hypothetical protein
MIAAASSGVSGVPAASSGGFWGSGGISAIALSISETVETV